MKGLVSLLAALCFLPLLAPAQDAASSETPRLSVPATPAASTPAPVLPLAGTPPPLVAVPLSATPGPMPSVFVKPTPVPPPKTDLYGNQQASQGIAQIAGYLVLLVALFAAGIYVMRNGIPTFKIGPKLDRKLNIEETRGLGNRQFLIVAEYDGHRMLLGVCPGRIEFLRDLPAKVAPIFPKIAPETEEPA